MVEIKDKHQLLPLEFYYQDKPIRVVRNNQGDIWFIAKDVCDVLGIEHHHHALANLDEDEKGGGVKLNSLGGPQSFATIDALTLSRKADILDPDKQQGPRGRSLNGCFCFTCNRNLRGESPGREARGDLFLGSVNSPRFFVPEGAKGDRP
ncbi:MAG: hypothetical protein C4575_09530 [Desulforudis sp.]|nr:MAG: hypothetical protein C4575_09530 [Desulforudis sp.]